MGALKSHLSADGSIASLESGDNNTKKKSTRNIQIKRSKLMNYGLWIVDRSIGKTSEKNNKYFIKLQIDKRKRIYLKRSLKT